MLAKLVEATQALDAEEMAYGIQQANALKVGDKPEVQEASRLLHKLNMAKAALKEALENVGLVFLFPSACVWDCWSIPRLIFRCQANTDDLELAISLGRPFATLAAEVARAEQLCKSLQELEEVRHTPRLA